MLFRRNFIGTDKIVRQLACFIFGIRHGITVDQLAISQQFIGEYIHLFLTLLAFTDDIAGIMMSEARLNTVGGIVGKTQTDGAGRGNRGMVCKTTAFFDQRIEHCHIFGIAGAGEFLHVAGIFRPQHAPLQLVTQLDTVGRQLRTLGQHLGGNFELFLHHWCNTFFSGQINSHPETGACHFVGHFFGKHERIRRTIGHAQHAQGTTKPEKTHTMTTLAHNFIALARQGQTVHFHHIVQHASEHGNHFAISIPVEKSFVGERVAHEFGQVDAAQQTSAIRRQRLLSTRVGRTHIFAEPVVIHLVNFVNEDKAGLCIIVGGCHDHIPQAYRLHGFVHLAGDKAAIIFHCIFGRVGHRLEHDTDLRIVDFCLAGRKDQIPVGIVFHRFHEVFGDQAGEVELTQASVLALGADKFDNVRMRDVECAHLGAAATAG